MVCIWFFRTSAHVSRAVEVAYGAADEEADEFRDFFRRNPFALGQGAVPGLVVTVGARRADGYYALSAGAGASP
jgi:hypothetical protein